MKKIVFVSTPLFLIFSVLMSCNINSNEHNQNVSEAVDDSTTQNPSKVSISDDNLDKENIEYEKTKVTFIDAKSINDGFEDAIRGLKKVENKTINENMVLELYKQGGNEEGTEWNFKAVIRIGDYYLPINLGIDHSIKIQDLVYNDNMQEIIINTGCFSDAGCLDKRMVLRTFNNRPFTLTDFGEGSRVYLTYKDLDGYTFNGYKEKLGAVLKSRELIIISTDYSSSQLIIQSYVPYKTGFAKGSFIKKIRVELAG